MSSQKSKGAVKATSKLPNIPDKLYFTIGEVARLCDLRPHVLRYWEQEFPQLSPAKRRGNRRYYQRQDVLLIRHIRNLLYEQGFTIEGARQQLSQEGKAKGANVDADVVNRAIIELEKVVVALETAEIA